jgi:hypothetical protein
MTTLNQIRVLLTLPGGRLGTNTLYVPNDEALELARENLAQFYDDYLTGNVADDFHATIPNLGEQIDSTTGVVSGFWDSGDVIQKDGTDTSNFVTDVSQVLLQMRTGFVVGGRELRGRLFLPGLRVTASSVGNVDTTVADQIADSANENLNDTFAVFSRTHHAWATIHSCTVWSEFASLRSRRG